MKYVITEAERREILGLYGIHREEKTPLQMLAECKFTTDGKFIIYEGIAYSCETGEQVPINEAWTFSDWAHTIGDVASAAADFIVPGSGALIDGVNAMTYFIEAFATKDPTKKHSLKIMGGITLAFALIPGVLQGVAIPLKQFVKTGKVTKSPLIAKGVKVISDSMGSIIEKIPPLLTKIKNSKFGQKILGQKFGWLTKYINNIMESVRLAFKGFSKAVEKSAPSAAGKAGIRAAKRGTLTIFNIRALTMFAKAGENLTIKDTGKLLRKIGFGPGKQYRYMTKNGPMTIKIIGLTEKEVQFTSKLHPGGILVNTATFLSQAVGAPWLRRGKSVAVPLFVKRLANALLPDGNGINEVALDKMPDADPEETSRESLSYTNEEVATYQGGQQGQIAQPGQYTVNPMVTNFQKALMALGYNLPQFGVDGKFGPETQEQLRQFQQDYQLEASEGKMDRATAKMLGKALVDKNVQDLEDVQSALNAA